MRIARALALGGVAARRKCERHILAGEVTVNGEVVTDLGRQVEPGKERVAFRGRPISFQEKVYYLLHKPAGYMTTVSDPHAKRTVYELLPRELKSASKPTVGVTASDSVARLTLASATPGTPRAAFSTRVAQDAQVMPATGQVRRWAEAAVMQGRWGRVERHQAGHRATLGP